MSLGGLRQQADVDKATALEKTRQQSEMAKISLESERLKLITEGKVSEACDDVESYDKHFDVLNDLHLVPKFNEKDIDIFSPYFTLFK